MGNPVRSFFALVPDEAGVNFLAQRMDLFRARGWEKFGRFVFEPDLHITLRFLGEIPEETAEVLKAGAAAIASRTAPFTYALGRCLLFPRVSRARVIAARVVPSEELRGLVRELEGLCVSSGLPPEERLFRPHVTLARLRSQTRRPNLPGRPGELVQHANRFHLLRTNLGGSPAAYEEVTSFRLEGADVAAI